MIDFDKADCQSESNAIRFGLHDPENNDKAYIDETGEVIWNCTVLNPKEYDCVFTAIDNCVKVVDGNGNDLRTCDGLLTYNNNLIFIELKHQGSKGWIPVGIDQLRKTMHLFMEGRALGDFTRKVAVVSNSKRPRFKFGHQSTMQRFRSETGFRLLLVGEITLK